MLYLLIASINMEEVIKKLTKEQKVELLTALLNDLNVIATGAYGAEEFISGDDVRLAAVDRPYSSIKAGDVYIMTGICTG
jgi:hypothetical protein